MNVVRCGTISGNDIHNAQISTTSGGNPKLSSNLKHSKASLKKWYKYRLTYKKSWEKKYFLYVLLSIGENHRGGEIISILRVGLCTLGQNCLTSI